MWAGSHQPITCRFLTKKQRGIEYPMPPGFAPSPSAIPKSKSLQQRRDRVRASQSAAAGFVANHAVRNRAERAHARLIVRDRVRVDRVTSIEAVGVGDRVG